MGEVVFSKSVNNAVNNFEPTGENQIVLYSGAKSDFFIAANGTEKYASAPILLTPINNREPFTFEVKVTPEWQETYDAGALYVFEQTDKWLKFAFEMDERKSTRMVTVRTLGASDDNNHDVVTSDAVYLKISSDTESIGYYYSTDRENWQLVRVHKNEYPDPLWIGISSQSPIGDGISTTFEGCSLSKTSVQDFRMGI